MKLRPILWLVAVALAVGCVPVKPPPGEKPFHEEFMSFVTVGETTREEVLDKFASVEMPLHPHRFADDAVWIYRADRDTWQWLVCAGAAYAAACDIVGTVRNYFLRFEFDEYGRVSSWYASSTLGECSSDGICEEGDAVMVYANEDRDERARLRPAADRCAIYVFSTMRGGDSVTTLNFDDIYVGTFINDGAYFRIEATPGEHAVTTAYCSSMEYRCGDFGINSQTLSIECTGGNQYFLHHDVRDKSRGAREFVLKTASPEGIDIRKLALSVLPGDQRLVRSPPDEATEIFARHMMKDLVWDVQLKLKDAGIYSGRIDGEFNEQTKSALRLFREQQGLDTGDLLDDFTLAALGVQR